MSQVYDGTRAGKTRMFQEALARAVAAGDAGMARGCRVELAALGVFETTVPDDQLEQVVPERPRKGRRPLPRCEHDMIAARCPDCSEDVV